MKTILPTLLSAALLFSCAAPVRMENRNRPEDAYSDAREPIIRSLFTDKNSTISEENIQKILDGNYKLPPQLHVAVVRMEIDIPTGRYARDYWVDECLVLKKFTFFTPVKSSEIPAHLHT